MIVPQPRLLWSIAVIAIPAALLATFVPTLQPAALAFESVLAAWILFDLVKSRRCFDGINVQGPKEFSLIRRRPAQIPILIQNQTRQSRVFRIGFPLAEEFLINREDYQISLTADAEFLKVHCECTPLQRGLFTLSTVVLEGASSGGFWAVRKHFCLNIALRVYPDLKSERQQVAVLLSQGATGFHAQRQVGKGREFEKLRDYAPGDDAGDIHWKATAKRGRPVTKVFQIERTQEVYVVLDSSRLMARALPGEEKETGIPMSFLDKSISAALLLAVSTEDHGDLFGLVTFTSQVKKFLAARGGKQHFHLCRETLYTLKPEPASPDYEELFTTLRLRLRRRALLVFMTALDDPMLAELFLKNLKIISRKHLVLVLMIQPKQMDPLFSGPTPAKAEDLFQELSGHMLWQNLKTLGLRLQREGVTFLLVPDERLVGETISQYIKVKQQQLL